MINAPVTNRQPPLVVPLAPGKTSASMLTSGVEGSVIPPMALPDTVSCCTLLPPGAPRRQLFFFIPILSSFLTWNRSQAIGDDDVNPTASLFSDENCQDQVAKVGINRGQKDGCTNTAAFKSFYLYYNC